MTPMNDPHRFTLMIDIESLGLSPDSRILQVGYCVGDLQERTIVKGPISHLLRVDEQKDRAVDFGTLSWWMQQDKAVAGPIFAPCGDRVPLNFLFSIFEGVVGLYPGCTVWASPAMFDLSMLTHAWDGKKPWSYSAERDMMTLYKLLDPKGELKPSENAKAHDAGADAEWQMQYLFRLYDRMVELQKGVV